MIDLAIAAALGGLAGLGAGEASRALSVRRWPSGTPDCGSWLLACVGTLALIVHPAGSGGLVRSGIEATLVGVVLLVLACDVRERAVYPQVVYPGIGLATAASPLLSSSIADALLGSAASTAIFAALYLVGRLRSGPGALGSGDIAAAALLGAVAGLSRLPAALLLVSIIGGGMALIVGLRARSLRVTFPYAPALCLGALGATLLRSF
jgi:prepilin signal peptidase PulO-like enzyme (type II secretory pathway)